MERDSGRGTRDGVKTAGSEADGFNSRLLLGFKETGLDDALESGFFLTGDAGADDNGLSSPDMPDTVTSCTLGRPACGPFKFRIEEKCSQS